MQGLVSAGWVDTACKRYRAAASVCEKFCLLGVAFVPQWVQYVHMDSTRELQGGTVKAKQIERAVEEALSHVESLIAASNGDESRCTTFRPGFGVEAFSDEQRRAVRIYVDTWIASPLQAALVLLREAEQGQLSARRVTEYIEYMHDRSAFGAELDADPAKVIRERF